MLYKPLHFSHVIGKSIYTVLVIYSFIVLNEHSTNISLYFVALDVLKSQNQKELFYQFTPALMQAVPKQMVNALISQGRGLSPAKLLPALVTMDDDQASEAMRYLEFCVHSLGCQQQAIHNYLLSLYARHNTKNLMEYLTLQGTFISV